MNIMKIFSLKSVMAVTMSACLSVSCVSETPFGDVEGEGHVRMQFVINSEVTRAAADEDALRANCKIYISNSKGVLYKWIGAQNIPTEALPLKYGEYLAEGWAGDSVPASYDTKYYKGSTDFTVGSGNPEQSVTITCRIANVVTSVDASGLGASGVSDLNVRVSSTNGALDFNSGNWTDAKGYFMMPYGETDLTYVISGKNSEGQAFEKRGSISNVKPAHEYELRLKYSDGTFDDGGAFITVEVDETVLVTEEEVKIYGKPLIVRSDNNGQTYSLDEQLQGTAGTFTDQKIRVSAFNGITSLKLNASWSSAFGSYSEVDFIIASENVRNELAGSGITYALRPYDSVTELERATIVFSAEWLNELPKSSEAYKIVFTAVDKNGKETVATFNIANTKEAYEKPSPVEPEAIEDLTAIGTSKAVVPVTVEDGAEGVGVRYRQSGGGDADWKSVDIVTRAGTVQNVTLTGLNADTEYEYQGYGLFNGETVYSKSKYFRTEGVFVIPNASMEDWSDWSENRKVLIPAPGGNRTFWDSGNHGSSTMSVTLTQGSSDMVHSGSISARLRSQFVGVGILGKFAAGNLFVGTYKETKGTNGVIDFGQPYNGSHPSKLRFWANYRPGSEMKGDGHGEFTSGPDHAQIYIAFTTGIKTVDTSNVETLFDPNSHDVLGYGEVTWKSDFGADNQLEEVNIPITWYDRAKSQSPTHMIIVCSASKYGDYFTGCEGSLLYVDDFELVYE